LGHDDRRRRRQDHHGSPPRGRAGTDARSDRPVVERLRRWRARRARSAGEAPSGALMGRFVVRRLVAMVAVLFAISVLTFMIFNVIPAGDPAQRMAGHSSSPATVAAIRKTWGFDQPVYVQYERMMSRVLTGKLVSYTTEQNVDKEIFHDIG